MKHNKMRYSYTYLFLQERDYAVWTYLKHQVLSNHPFLMAYPPWEVETVFFARA